MELFRLSDSVVADNAWLVGGALALALLLVWVGVVGGALAMRWLFRTSRVDLLARAGERLVAITRTMAWLASPGLVLVAIAVLGYGIWRDVDLQRWAAPTLEGLSAGTLERLGVACLAVVGVGIALVYLRSLAAKHLPRLRDRVLLIAAVAPHRDAVTKIFGELPEVLGLALAHLAVVVTAQMLGLTGGLPWVVDTIIIVGLVLNAARMFVQIAWLALALFDGRMLAVAPGNPLHEYYDRVHPLMPLARRVLEAIIYVSGAIIIVERFAALEAVVRFGSMSIELIVVFFFARVLIELVGVLAYKLLLRDVDDGPSEGASIERELALEEIRARRVTLAQLTQSLCRFMIYVGMAMMMLVVVGVDPLPLLAGLGIVGFAVGLGSQKIIQDIICGFFMLLEDQMLIGDYVKVEDTEGVVEQLHLRVSRIRDRFGRVHTIRNGDVGNVINYSRGWTLAVVEMSVAYESDLADVIPVMQAAGDELHRRHPDKVLEPSKVMGIEAMDDSCLRVRTETRVRPGCHYEMKRALNRLLFEAFVAHGLEIPYPKGIEFDGVPASPPEPTPGPARAPSER